MGRTTSLRKKAVLYAWSIQLVGSHSNINVYCAHRVLYCVLYCKIVLKEVPRGVL